jgi:hypothetical protein
MERAGGKCAAISIAQGVAEIRFELVEDERTARDTITQLDYLHYQRALHKHTVSTGEYNT